MERRAVTASLRQLDRCRRATLRAWTIKYPTPTRPNGEGSGNADVCFAGLPITANILMSLAVDRSGLFGMQVHELSTGHMAGAALMVVSIALISKF